MLWIVNKALYIDNVYLSIKRLCASFEHAFDAKYVAVYLYMTAQWIGVNMNKNKKSHTSCQVVRKREFIL